MVSRRKLEEEIARTTDPVIRKQLQELLDKREKRRDEGKETVKKLVKKTGKALDETFRVPAWCYWFLWGIVILILIFCFVLVMLP